MGELEKTTKRFFDLLEQKDVEPIIQDFADDVQAVDEISRRWMRGAGELGAYMRQLVKMADNVHTDISDANETVRGDIGLMTCWMEQDYTLEGKSQHVSAPTTIAFRKESGAWKMLLFHSIPLAPEEA
ncbi:MAG: nuclear transport factor 2 family protein [Candidatus Dormibacteraeota bacterium]|nr:nuclear transport factor 2 family protein [Candidatus Dormibacteraeota bacterium]